MKHLTELILLTNLLLVTKSTSDFKYEEDFIHSFLIKSEKLTKSERLKTADSNWMTRSGHKVSFKDNPGPQVRDEVIKKYLQSTRNNL